MNGPARRRILLVGLCICIAGCAAQKIPLEPFASDSANEAPPAKVSDDLKLSIDHGPPPSSPYAKGSSYASNTVTESRAATPAQFTSGHSRVETPRSETPRPAAVPKVGDAAALASVMAELEALGPIDPAIQARLVDDLRQTDPSLWPTLLQTFKAGIAFKQRAAAAPKTAERPPLERNAVERSPNERGADEDQPPKFAASPAATSTPLIPPSVLAQLRTADEPAPFSNLPLDALGGGGMTPRNGASPGLALPTQTILQAAMAEAQRKDEEQSRTLPPAGKSASKVSVSMQLERDPEETITKTSAISVDTVCKTDSATKPDATGVAAAAPWRESLQLVITGLESETREPPHSAAEVSRHAWLRMLYLAAGRREDALKPIPGIAAAEQDFWSEQIYGLATYLDTEKLTDPARRSAEARSHLAKAEKRLSDASTLAVKALNFCTEVSSYGVYEKFKEYRFKAGQPLILYCEVENFRSEESAKGFHTALRSSYQILDPQGRRVAEHDLAVTEEFCQNERRDYFIRYFVSVPERIYDGKYTLQLTIVDTLSQKIGQSTIDFHIGEEKK